jgi:hypothetical protein
MRESGLQRKARNQNHGDVRGRGRPHGRRGGEGRSGIGGAGGGPSEVRVMKEKVVEVAQRVAGGARAAKEQVMQKAADVTRAVADGVKEEAERIFDEQKERIGSKVDRWGKAIHQAAHALHAVKADGAAEMVDAAAERVGNVSSYLEERSLTDILSDAEDVARRHPGVMLGGMFVAGLLAARFLKASAARRDESESEGDEA